MFVWFPSSISPSFSPFPSTQYSLFSLLPFCPYCFHPFLLYFRCGLWIVSWKMSWKMSWGLWDRQRATWWRKGSVSCLHDWGMCTVGPRNLKLYCVFSEVMDGRPPPDLTARQRSTTYIRRARWADCVEIKYCHLANTDYLQQIVSRGSQNPAW